MTFYTKYFRSSRNIQPTVNMSRRGSIIGSDGESGSVLDYNFSTNVASIDKRSYITSTRQPNDANAAGSVVNASQVGSTTSSLEDYYNESIVTQLEERSFMFLLNLQTRQELVGRNEYIKTLLIRLYFIWATLVIAIQPSYNFGEYGRWIARAVNYPLTFGFEHLPYTAAVIIAGIIFAIQLLQVIILIIAYRSIYRMSKYWPKIKVITRILNVTISLTSLPISWLMLGFLNCNYSSAVLVTSSTTAEQVLNRFPDVACYSGTNLAFIIIGLLSYVLTIFTTFVGFYTTTDANPRSETPFLTFDAHLYFLSVLSYQIYYLLINVVGDQFVVIQAVYFVVASFCITIFFLFSMPFYRRWENAVYFGFVCATLGGSLCGVVSTYVNTQNEYGLGLGLLGMTIGVMIIFSFIGWLCMDLWTRYINKDLRGIFMNHLERGLDNLSNDDIMNPKYILEKESIKILQEIEETNRSRRLFLFLKWCMKKGSTSTLGNLSDLELSKCFIKGVANQKTYQNVDLLIAASIICGNFFETGQQKSLAILEKLSSNIKNSYYVCMPSAVPRLLLREIRVFQNFMILYPTYKNELISSGLHDVVNVTNFFQDKLERMEKYKGLLDELKLAEASGTMSSESIADYTNPIYTLVTPVLYYSNDSTIPSDYIQSKNASISEITDSLIKYAKTYLKKEANGFNTTITSGDFMFLWTNRNGGSSAFDAYCDLFLRRNSESVQNMNIQFIAFYVAAVVVYGVCAAIVVMILLVHLRSLRSSIKFIATTLPKDQVGKIFQGLDKKSDEEMDIKENGIISKPQTTISLVVVSSIIVTVLCITMLFVDMQIISNTESLAIKYVTSGVEIFRNTNRAAYRMTELFSFMRYTSKSSLNDDRLLSQSDLSTYHVQMKSLFGTIASSWEVLRYGGRFMNTYEDIDILISPITNCTNVSTFYCTNLDELVTEISTVSLRLNEDVYYSNYAIDNLFLTLLKGSEMSNALMDRIIDIFDLYSTYASTPSFTLSIIAVVIGYIALISLSYFAYVLIRDFWDQIQQLRSLLNYLPVEYIDSNDALKQFVLFNDLSSKSRASSSEKSKEKDGGGDGK
ncbi:predicted protein, partial [Naegleria gruberi]